jgi:hypothetical protein
MAREGRWGQHTPTRISFHVTIHVTVLYTRLDVNKTQTVFRDRDDTLFESVDRHDTPAQVRGLLVHFTLYLLYSKFFVLFQYNMWYSMLKFGTFLYLFSIFN